MEIAMEQQQQSENIRQRWRSAAAVLVLAALLAAPITIVATMANPPAKASLLQETISDPEHSLPELSQRPSNDFLDVGSFAFGYVEFDVDPSRGVPGFDVWPPGLPRR
jgi:hypothetical protein